MDMAKLHNLAYDYASDLEQEAVVDREIRQKKNTDTANKFFSLRFVVLCALVCGLLCVMIYGKVQISDLSAEQTRLQTELTELRNGNTSLESELAQKTSMTKIEEYAKNEGLVKLDRSQIEYVEVDSDAVASVVETKDRSIFVRIKNWFVSKLEYFGL
ncbi:MAG: septum formation inhibitor [Ruminococcus sp.]|nr:septum formation inhibitor [Ruminococcus sp.]